MLVQMALTWRLQIGIFSKMFGDIKDSHLIHGNVSSGPQRIYMGLAIGLQRPVLVKEGLYANFNIVNLREYRSGIKPRFLSKINLNPQFMQRIHLSNWNFDKVLDYNTLFTWCTYETWNNYQLLELIALLWQILKIYSRDGPKIQLIRCLFLSLWVSLVMV